MDLQRIYELMGPCGVCIVIMGIAALYICIRNLVYTYMSWKEFKRKFIDIRQNGESCLRDYAGGNPFLNIIHDIVATHASHSDDMRAEVAYLYHKNFKEALNGLTWLKMITVISPLCGLLGTVGGMLAVFDAVSQAAAQNPELLARGIWQALITTVMGLSVAIPTLVVFYLLSLRMRIFRIEIIEYCYQAISICKGAHAAIHTQNMTKAE